MTFVTLILLSALLCAESPGGSIEDRTLIAHTVFYRSEVRGLSVLAIVLQPYQYQGLALIDWDKYRLYRKSEMQDNFKIVTQLIFSEDTIEVSNFCEVGFTCSWQSSCRLIESSELHHFYLCKDWELPARD